MVGVGSSYGTAAEERAAELLAWLSEGNGAEGLREMGLPDQVIGLLEAKAQLTDRIACLEQQEASVMRRLVEAVEGL